MLCRKLLSDLLSDLLVTKNQSTAAEYVTLINGVSFVKLILMFLFNNQEATIKSSLKKAEKKVNQSFRH